MFNISAGSLKDKNNNILEDIDISTTDGASKAIIEDINNIIER